MLFELERGSQKGAGLGGDDARQGEGQRFAVVALERRLEIKGVDLRRAPMEEQEDDAFGARFEMGLLVGERGCLRLVKHRAQGDGAKARAAAGQHLSAAQRRLVSVLAEFGHGGSLFRMLGLNSGNWR